MEIAELEINGAWIVQAPIHNDNRGYLREWFKGEEFEFVTGRKFNVQQRNISSPNKGILRGIHYSLAKEGQGFVSTEDNSCVAYLLTSTYVPADEFEIYPLDPELGIIWLLENLSLSLKDANAPTLLLQLSAGKREVIP